MQPNRQRGELPNRVVSASLTLWITLAQQRSHDLLDEPDLAIGRHLEGARAHANGLYRD